MATPDSIGTCDCLNCGREVFVRKNRGGFAYFRCEGCGVAVQHHIHRHSETFIKNRVRLEDQEVAQVVQAEKMPAPKAAEKPAQKVPARGSLAELLGVAS